MEFVAGPRKGKRRSVKGSYEKKKKKCLCTITLIYDEQD
jgi:hypothetical protein